MQGRCSAVNRKEQIEQEKRELNLVKFGEEEYHLGTIHGRADLMEELRTIVPEDWEAGADEIEMQVDSVLVGRIYELIYRD